MASSIAVLAAVWWLSRGGDPRAGVSAPPWRIETGAASIDSSARLVAIEASTEASSERESPRAAEEAAVVIRSIESGIPLAGALVRSVRLDDGRASSASSGSDGVCPLDPGHYVLEVRAAGHLPRREMLSLRDGRQVLELRPSSRVILEFRDEQGLPVPSVGLRLFVDGFPGTIERRLARWSSLLDGAWPAGPLDPEEVLALFHDVRDAWTFEERLSGSDGRATWTDVPPEVELTAVVTTDHLLELLPPLPLRVARVDSLRTRVRLERIEPMCAGPGEDVHIAARVLATASISGRAASRARIRVTHLPLHPRTRALIGRGLIDVESHARDDGTFDLAGLRPGDKHLSASWSEGHVHVFVFRSLDLAAAEHLDLGQLVPDDTLVRCRVRCVAEDGSEVPVAEVLYEDHRNARITLARRGGSLDSMELAAPITVPVGEPFELHGLPDGEYRVAIELADTQGANSLTPYAVRQHPPTSRTPLVVRGCAIETVEFDLPVAKR